MESLLDIRDELAAAKNLAAALHMACDARSMPGGQRAALCEASNVVRERLETIVAALDQILAGRTELGDSSCADAFQERPRDKGGVYRSGDVRA